MNDPLSKTDELAAYFLGDQKDLSPALEETFHRLDFADNLVCEFGASKSSAKKIMEKFGCSHAQAYRYMNRATELFGSVGRASKERHKSLAVENLQFSMRVAKSKLVDENGVIKSDVKSADIRLISEIQAEIRRTIGYDLELPDMPNWADIGANVIVISTSPELLGVEPIENLDEAIERIKNPKKRHTPGDFTDAEIVSE